MLFFDLLPCELQLEVLLLWSEILGIRAFDTACCNHGLRQHCVSLIGHSAFSRSNCYSVKACHVVSDMLCFMRWLASRHVNVKALYFTESNLRALEEYSASGAGTLPFTLPSIDSIILADKYRRTFCLQKALSSCPNITSISSSSSNILIGSGAVAHGSNGGDVVWINLCCMPAIWKLKQLKVASFLLSDIAGGGWKKTLLGVGFLLEDLCMLGVSLQTDVLAGLAQLPNLVRLEISSVTKSTVCLLLEKCLHLRKISIQKYLGELTDIVEIIHAQPLLSELDMVTLDHRIPPFKLMAGMLLNHPSLHYLQAGSCLFDFSIICTGGGGRLVFTTEGLKVDDLERMIHVCSAKVTSLKVTGTLDLAMMTLVTEKLGPHLVDLTLLDSLAEPFLHIPMRCPHLTRLHMDGNFNTKCLQDIGKHCQQLNTIYLNAQRSSYFTNPGLQAIFAGCQRLKVLDVGAASKITFLSLKAIVSNHLRLERMTWKGERGFNKQDEENFLQLAKEQQLLPLPVFLMT